jgi:hypothetical protein
MFLESKNIVFRGQKHRFCNPKTPFSPPENMVFVTRKGKLILLGVSLRAPNKLSKVKSMVFQGNVIYGLFETASSPVPTASTSGW